MSVEDPREGGGRDPRLVRVSHADRDRVVEILRDAMADGRLDGDEFEERVERALTARTVAELESLVDDLPVAEPVPPRTRALEPVPEQPYALATLDREAHGEVVRWTVHGQRLRREGAWLVPRVVELELHGGSARLDYTLARLPEGGESMLRVLTHGGRVRLTVPPWIAVDLSGISTQGGRVRDHHSHRAAPGMEVRHVITVTGKTHGGSVRVEVSHEGRGRDRWA